MEYPEQRRIEAAVGLCVIAGFALCASILYKKFGFGALIIFLQVSLVGLLAALSLLTIYGIIKLVILLYGTIVEYIRTYSDKELDK